MQAPQRPFGQRVLGQTGVRIIKLIAAGAGLIDFVQDLASGRSDKSPAPTAEDTSADATVFKYQQKYYTTAHPEDKTLVEAVSDSH